MENSVTILRLVRSSLQKLHRYDNFESSQINDGVAGAALSCLCALQLRLCYRRRFVKRSPMKMDVRARDDRRAREREPWPQWRDSLTSTACNYDRQSQYRHQ